MAEILCSLSILSHKSSFSRNKPHQMGLHLSVLSNQAHVFDACLNNHGGLFKHFLTYFSLFYTPPLAYQCEILVVRSVFAIYLATWNRSDSPILYLSFTYFLWQIEILVTDYIFPLVKRMKKCCHVPHMNKSTFIFMHEMFILFSQ